MNEKNRANLIIHPDRLRIIAQLGGEDLSPGKLLERLPDISQATLYRHLKSLEKGGIISVKRTRRIRGTLEKIYGMENPELTRFSRDDLKQMNREDHNRFFTAFLGSLYNSYLTVLDYSENDPSIMESTGYHTTPVKLSPDQIISFQEDFRSLLTKYGSLPDSKERKTYYLSTTFIPEVKYEP